MEFFRWWLVAALSGAAAVMAVFPWERQANSAYEIIAQTRAAQRLDIPSNDLEFDRRHREVESFIDLALSRKGPGLLSLWQDQSGNIYAADLLFGANGAGCLFKLFPDGERRTVYDFCGRDESASPETRLTSPLNARPRWDAIVNALAASPTPQRLRSPSLAAETFR